MIWTPGVGYKDGEWAPRPGRALEGLSEVYPGEEKT